MKNRADDNSTPTRVVSDLREAARAIGRHQTVCCVGVFDGVHRGHQRLIAAAVEEARQRRCWSVVLTFRNHPLTVLAPAYAPLLLTDPEEKVRRLIELHPTLVACIPFDRETADLEPATFVKEILAEQLHAASVWCGSDFRFGRGGTGDARLLEQMGQPLGMAAHTIEPVFVRNHLVSSTLIRSLVEQGEVQQAAECLGRDHVVEGPVVSGHGRGRQLGYPTANLAPPPAVVLPADGIYAVRVEAGGRLHDGMMHLGPAPTFDIAQPRLEVHLFDFRGELLGKTIRIHFVSFLREVLRFDSADQLVAQIKADEQNARTIPQSKSHE